MKADNTDFPEKPACRYLSLFIPKILALNEDIDFFGLGTPDTSCISG